VFATEADRKQLLGRLARVGSQLRGVQRMIESGDQLTYLASLLAWYA